MKISLQNIVEFQFTSNPTYGIQRLRMTPKESERQKKMNLRVDFGISETINYFIIN